MSENIEDLRGMLLSFRVSELQMLLGFAGRNKSGRKTELQQRALQLLSIRSHPIHQKIRELYKTVQANYCRQTVALASVPQNNLPPTSEQHQNNAMPQQPPANISRNTAQVHPFNLESRQINTRQASATAALYGTNLPQNMYYQYTNPKQTPVLTSNFPVHPDVVFRRLPFYDVVADLVKPSTLVPQTNQRMQEQPFYFHLTPQQATDIASSRDIRPGVKCDYSKQVQLRFCLLETTCEQEDCFPPQVMVKVNGKLCPLPNPIPTNKPGVEPKRPPRPVNITQMVKLSPTVPNTITVSWAADYGRGYAMAVSLVHKLTSSDLLHRLQKKGVKHSDHTRALIKEKMSDNGDVEISATSVRVSLMCPLGKMRMTTPCRSQTCSHLQCFDASLYLQMNERKATWNCPICDKPALYDNLVIDGYFQEVLNSSLLPSDCKAIQLMKDGSWNIESEERKAPTIGLLNVNSIAIDDSIEIIEDSFEVVSSKPATSTTDKPKLAIKSRDVVDLTTSDSEDDEPLAKRRALATPDSTIKFNESQNITSSGSLIPRITTPGPSSVSSSGYPASPRVINLDSPSPPRSPPQSTVSQSQPPPPPPPSLSASQQQANNNQQQQGFDLSPNDMTLGQGAMEAALNLFTDRSNESTSGGATSDIGFPANY